MLTRGRKSFVPLAAFLLIALHVALGLRAVAEKSITVDEIFHITGGYLFDRYSDFRIHPDNGILPQRLHGLPAVLLGAHPPPFENNEYWRHSDAGVVSHQFFYEVGNDHGPILMAARAANLLFNIGTLLLVFFWARHLAGNVAALVALGLAALSPTLLAHGPLATSDAAATLFLAGSATLFWWQLRTPGPRATVLSALVFGLACNSKFSAVLLLPTFIVLIAVHACTVPREARRFGRILGSLLLHGAAAVLLIWACYSFRYTGFAPGVPGAEHFITTWDWMLARIGWQGTFIGWAREYQLLPEAFLFGYTHTYVGSLTRASYLAGEFSDFGWRTFFPLAFAWKSTPLELGGAFAAIAVAIARWRRSPGWMLKLAPLLVFAAVYGGVAITSRLNIGHRHLLPLYPILFIGIGVLVARLAAHSPRATMLAFPCVAAQAAAALLVFPHYLAYFNLFAGGPEKAWRRLVDSSLDWGQDLPGLARWLERENTGAARVPVFLSYFGSGEPAYHGIAANHLPFVNGFKQPHPYVKLGPGLYCVSATMLVHVYSAARGPWTPAFEQEYQKLRAMEPQFADYVRDPQRRAELLREATHVQWQNALTRHDQLRFARLCHYLRVRPPDDTIGHSILIFRLSAGEVAATTAGTLDDWQRALERATASR